LPFALLPVVAVGVVVMFLVGLVRPSRSRRVQAMVDDVFSGRRE
jgi:hypothetical protein